MSEIFYFAVRALNTRRSMISFGRETFCVNGEVLVRTPTMRHKASCWVGGDGNQRPMNLSYHRPSASKHVRVSLDWRQMIELCEEEVKMGLFKVLSNLESVAIRFSRLFCFFFPQVRFFNRFGIAISWYRMIFGSMLYVWFGCIFLVQFNLIKKAICIIYEPTKRNTKV